MKNIAKVSIICLGIILSQVLLYSVCCAVPLKETGFKINRTVEDGTLTAAEVIIKASNGGPMVNSIKTDYPPSTILMVTASLTIQDGFYQVELFNKDKKPLKLTAKIGKTVKDSSEITVDKSGSIRYRVLAKKANNIVLNLSFNPVAVNKIASPNQVSSYDKTSGTGDGLNLTLTCLSGKNCIIKVQNVSKTKAYRNILFQMDYKLMVEEDIFEKIKRGTIDDVLLADETREWPIGLVFGEPPRFIKIKLLSAEAVDPATVTGTDQNQPPKEVILNAISERQLTK
jgi:hypothetical protein